MRRLKILFYWFFKARFNVSFGELIKFMVKPTIKQTTFKYVKAIEKQDEFYEVSFKEIPHKLYWASKFPIEGFYQVCAETFDKNDWHYYQKKNTEVEKGEIILDIGTAEGLMPLTVIDKVEKIIMIEPSQYFYQSLQKTFASFMDKVEIIHSAVGKAKAVAFLDDNSLASEVSSQGKGKEIEVNTIDELISPTEKITYLKADIEGFEYDMLLGAKNTIQRNKPKIAITTYHTENDHKEIIKLLKSYVPEYKCYVKGVFHITCKPVMIHFYL